MDNPFDGRLPLGWTATLAVSAGINVYPVWAVYNIDGVLIAYCQIDSVMPTETHIKYARYRHNLDAS